MIEFLRLYLLLWAVFPLPPAAPPEAEAVRDVLGDRGEEEDELSRHRHHQDTQPAPGGRHLAWSCKLTLPALCLSVST